MIDGHSVAVPGILWVVAFALRGVPWALEEIKKPEVDAEFRKYLLNQRCHRRQAYINRLDAELKQAIQLQEQDNATIHSLAGQLHHVGG